MQQKKKTVTKNIQTAIQIRSIYRFTKKIQNISLDFKQSCNITKIYMYITCLYMAEQIIHVAISTSLKFEITNAIISIQLFFIRIITLAQLSRKLEVYLNYFYACFMGKPVHVSYKETWLQPSDGSNPRYPARKGETLTTRSGLPLKYSPCFFNNNMKF